MMQVCMCQAQGLGSHDERLQKAGERPKAAKVELLELQAEQAEREVAALKSTLKRQ